MTTPPIPQPPALPALPPAEKYRQVAARFSELVAGTSDWDAPTPVKEWRARDVVGHLASWVPAMIGGGAGIEFEAGPSVEDDPVAAWTALDRQLQAILDDPASAQRLHRNPHTAETPLPTAIDTYVTGDVFFHTWDLARATGQDDTLDADLVHEAYVGMSAQEEFLRPTGQFGERQPVPDDATEQDRLIAFLGRDPRWAPPAT